MQQVARTRRDGQSHFLKRMKLSYPLTTFARVSAEQHAVAVTDIQYGRLSWPGMSAAVMLLHPCPQAT